ncbi:neuronal acetylcholine receptor subunit alpha-3-like [Branchiostoma floridae x Branchiostoma belcheri]
MKSFLIVGLVLVSTLCAGTFAYEAVGELLDAVWRQVHPRVIPMRNNRTAVVVEVSLTISSILAVDDKNQELKTMSWLQMSWTDYQLKWNPREHDNIKKLNYPADRLWTPDLVPYNSRLIDSGIDTSVSCIVMSNGEVTYIPRWLTHTSCAFDATYYPYDVQTCNVKLGSWTHHVGELDLRLAPGRDSISLEPFTEDSTWKIKKTEAKRQVMQYACCPESFVHVDFSIALQRSPSALLQFNLIAPTVLFLAAAVLGFYLPSDTGSRTLLGVVSLLGVTLVSLLNYGNFPLGSNATTPIIGEWSLMAMSRAFSLGNNKILEIGLISKSLSHKENIL